MNNIEEVLTVSEKAVRASGLPYIKEVAERSGMTDRETILELYNRGWTSDSNTENDASAILDVMIDSYKKELLVHAKVNKDTELLKQLGIK